MGRWRALTAALLPVILVVAIGVAAGVWRTPVRSWPDAHALLTSTSVTLPTVLAAGLADGINPCAFTVLLLFVAAVTATYRDAGGPEARARLLGLGGVFIAAIFATYLALGVGLLRASTLLTQGHVGARLGALAAVFLGLWMLKDALVPGWGPQLRAPAAMADLVRVWGQRATLAGMAGLGVLVGLCTVPCSGAVYLAVVSLLALQERFIRAYGYLVLYNVMFVLPLLAILAAASARPTLNRLARWNLHHRERVRLALGGGVVALGLAVLATV